MGHRSSRERAQNNESDETETETDSRTPFSSSSTVDRKSTGRGAPEDITRAAGSARTSGSGAPVQRATTAGRVPVQTSAPRGSGESYVAYDPGPDRESLSTRYGLEVREGQARVLQRLETKFGPDRVRAWAEEGMPVGTMGKPRDMEAVRKRQAERPEEVPTDVERRNEASVQRNAARNREEGPAGEAGVPDVVRDVVSSPGKSLDDTVQREMGTKMGGDFGDVRVHTGPQAAAAADAINARAFTVGNHVAFNRGEYRPERPEGQRVLAHELTHVRQQTEGEVSMLPKADASLAIDPDPTLEREAEEAAQEVTAEPRTVRRLGAELHVQPKLELNSPSDPAEHEAERVAEQVMDTSPSEAAVSPEETEGVNRDASPESAVKHEAQQRVESVKVGDESPAPSLRPSRTIQRQAAAAEGGSEAPKGEAAAEGGGEAETEAKKQEETYTVQEGDTLTEIASRFNVPGGWRTLWETNKKVIGKTPDYLLPGYELLIPRETQDAADGGEAPKEPEGGFIPAPSTKKSEPEGGSAPGPDETEVSEGPADPGAGGELASEPKTPVESSPDLSDGTGGRTAVEEPATTASEDAAPASPQEDPAFQSVVEQTEAVADEQAAHPPAGETAAAAQSAAEGPPNERESKAAANQVDEMAKQEPEPFDRAAFKEALMQKIKDTAPSDLEEADKFEKNNELGAVKGELNNEVGKGKKKAQGPIEQKAEEPPDTSSVEPKQSSPMEPPDPGPQPQVAEAAGAAAPKPKSDAEVREPFEKRSQKLDQQMAAEGVSEEQLEKSNEPELKSALKSKRGAQSHASEAPSKFRETEQKVVSRARSEAESLTANRMQSIHAASQRQTDQVGRLQKQAKTEDEQKRAEVASRIQQIYDDTKQRVQERLSRLDTEVNETFEEGAEKARTAFEGYVDERMSEYKEERYSGAGNVLRVTDWANITSLPPEVNEFYKTGRDRYIEQMNGVLDRVVDVVARGLEEAKQMVADGRQTVREYVEGLPQSLRAVGQQAAANIQSKFDELEQSVNDKKGELVDSLAQKYNERLEQIDSRIEELKAQNKSLFDSAMAAIGGAVTTINNLKSMLMGVLAKASGAITSIINDPIGFLDNLVAGVQGGLEMFLSNIGTHLQQGLIGWLTGAVVPGGLELPEELDLKGIFSIVTQILGLTYENIKKRAEGVFGSEVVGYLEAAFEFFTSIASKGVPDLSNFGEILELIYEGVKERAEATLGSKTVERLETTYQIVRSVISEGLSALLNVQEILQMLDLKEMILGKIKDVVRNEVIEAGIQWIIGLLSPASAFIKACKMIYDVINFFVTRGKQIMSVVNSVLDSVLAIAKGKTGGVASKVSEALGAQVPVLISFLASLLGLTGIASRVQGIIESAKSTVDKGIDWVLEKVKGVFTSIGEALSGLVSGSDGGEKERGEAPADGEGSQQAVDFDLKIPFQTAGEDHTLQTRGDSFALVMRSEPTLLSQHPDQKVQRKYDEYRKVADNENLSETKKQELLKDKAEEIIRFIKETEQSDEPQASAPRIGEIQKHGENPTSLRKGPEIWHLTSEHILPFSVGKTLWQVFNDSVPGRGSTLDRKQTTIMIYKKAATKKTAKENSENVHDSFESEIKRKRAEFLSLKRKYEKDGDEDALAEGRVVLFDYLERYKQKSAEAVVRTGKSIEEENQMRMGGHQLTNGERRAPEGETEPPIPRAVKLEHAAEQQMNDVLNLVREEIEDAAEEDFGWNPP